MGYWLCKQEWPELLELGGGATLGNGVGIHIGLGQRGGEEGEGGKQYGTTEHGQHLGLRNQAR